ncbi:hypothetical protein EBZ37_04940 [bacterium]|nr:hypothetical protein [bacterium]
MNGNAGSLDQVLGHLRSSADDSRRRGELVEGAISQAIRDFAALREQITQTQNQKALLQASFNELQSTLHELKENHSRSLARNHQLESTLKLTQEQQSQSLLQTQSAQERIRLLEQETRNLRHKLFHAHHELENQKKFQIEESLSSKKTISELRDRLEKTSLQLNQANELNESLKQDRQSLNHANLEAQIQISSLAREQQRLAAEKSAKSDELQAMKSYSEELRRYIDTCISRYQDHSRSMHQILLQAQDSLSQERKARSDEVARYQEQVHQLRRELDQIPKLQDQVGSLSEENEKLSRSQPIQALLSLKQKQIDSIRAKLTEDSISPPALAQAKKLLMNLEEQKQVLLALLGKSSAAQDLIKKPISRVTSLISNEMVN